MIPTRFLICDLETTAKEICNAEIITASFIVTDLNLKIIDKKTWKMSPTFWNPTIHDGSVAIHGINRAKAFTFPDKTNALMEIMDWIRGHTYHFSGHFNRQTMNGHVSYDYAVLQQEFLDIGMHFEWNQLCRSQHICSTHTLAKKANDVGRIHVPLVVKAGNKKASRDFSLGNLCSILNIPLIHHDSESDVNAAWKLMLEFSKMIDIFSCIENDWRQTEFE